MKKAQVLGVLAVAGALVTTMSCEAWAVEGTKPSIVELVRATNEAEIAMLEAEQAGEGGYASYLKGLVAEGAKAQSEYNSRMTEDLDELIAALEDGAYVTRLEIKTKVTPVKAATEKEAAATTKSEPKQAIAKPNQQAPKVVLATPKVAKADETVGLKAKKVSAPNTSAGKLAVEAVTAESTLSVAAMLMTMICAAGLGTKAYRKAKNVED